MNKRGGWREGRQGNRETKDKAINGGKDGRRMGRRGDEGREDKEQ